MKSDSFKSLKLIQELLSPFLRYAGDLHQTVQKAALNRWGTSVFAQLHVRGYV